MAEHDAHDIGAVLRGFFRDLPEPIIPFGLYEPLLKIQKDASIPREKRVELLRDILIRMPAMNLPLLKFLVKFLQEVEANSETNKMSVA